MAQRSTLAHARTGDARRVHLVRRRNTARREALLQAIHEYLRGRVSITGDGAGAHIVLWPNRRASEDAIVAQAASRGVGVYGISPYFLTKPARTGIMLGYARLREAEIRECIRRLAEVL